ncbi:MAG: M28 family peptidase [Verrucomicrobiota bacterium]
MIAPHAAESNRAAEAHFLSHARQLIYEGQRSGEGYFAPDGKALIFQSEREAGNPFYQIYILNLETGDTHRVSPGHGKTTCAFFRPRSSEVLFSSTHHDPASAARQQAELEFRASGKQRRYSWDYDEQMEIYSAHRDGSGLKRLTESPGYDAEASYSPDGRQVVFCSLRTAYPTHQLSAENLKRFEVDPSFFGEIFIMNADGSKVRQLTQAPGYDGGPFFTPDGKRIVWRRFDETGAIADVYTMKRDGSDPRRITEFGCMSWAPYFHPSGRYLVFTANKLGFSNFELFIVDADGKKDPVRVTHTDGFDGLPVFSPDGRKLCWTSGRTSDGKSQLFIANWNHEHALAALRSAPPRGQSPPPLHAAHASATATAPAQTPPSSHPPAQSKFVPEISAEDLRTQVEYLASDTLEGRMTGSKGIRLAADFIAETLRKAGLKPFGASDSYFQTFEFNAGVRVLTNANQLSFEFAGAHTSFAPEQDFRPLSFTANGSVEGEIVFAGYGLSVPGKPGEGYDSYAGLDVTNKIVLVLRYVPEGVEPKRRQELNRYAALRYKAMIAREHGAKALLVVTGPNSPNAGELIGLSFDSSSASSEIMAASVTSKVADALFAAAGKDLKTVQSNLDTENPHAEGGFALKGVRLKLSTAVEHIRKSDRNVLAYLPAARGDRVAEHLLVGAHYDHLGYGETGAMKHSGEETAIHNGADDNASGVAAVLELAAALAAEQKRNSSAFQRAIVFAFWSGEELGLIGSSHYVEHPVWPLSNLVACLNFDMVGRLQENKLNLQGTASSTLWRRLAEKRNVAAGFNLVLQDDPYLPTDVTAFYPKQIPVLNFFTGSHADYHRPTDDADRIQYEGLERIARFAQGILLDLTSAPARPDYVKVDQSTKGGSRDSLRAYLGTIPDYTTETKGVKLSGVRGGSPAEKSGIKAGDVIIEFAGQKIANIYDYTYALDAARIGQPVEIAILRDGNRVVVTVTPEARK